MSVRVVLEDLLGASPRKARYLTSERLLAFVSLVSQILSFAVLRRPSLGPIHKAVASLLTPSGGAGDRDLMVSAAMVLQQIRRLREKLTRTNDEDQAGQLQAQIDVLLELLVRA